MPGPVGGDFGVPASLCVHCGQPLTPLDLVNTDTDRAGDADHVAGAVAAPAAGSSLVSSRSSTPPPPPAPLSSSSEGERASLLASGDEVSTDDDDDELDVEYVSAQEAAPDGRSTAELFSTDHFDDLYYTTHTHTHTQSSKTDRCTQGRPPDFG